MWNVKERKERVKFFIKVFKVSKIYQTYLKKKRTKEMSKTNESSLNIYRTETSRVQISLSPPFQNDDFILHFSLLFLQPKFQISKLDSLENEQTLFFLLPRAESTSHSRETDIDELTTEKKKKRKSFAKTRSTFQFANIQRVRCSPPFRIVGETRARVWNEIFQVYRGELAGLHSHRKTSRGRGSGGEQQHRAYRNEIPKVSQTCAKQA